MTFAERLAAIDTAIALLASAADPEATLVATALRRWHDGESLDTAMGLPTDWRDRARIAKRDRALQELVKTNPELDATGIARHILRELPGCTRQHIRPDGQLGHIFDLAALEFRPSERHLRRLLTQVRGQQRECNGHDSSSRSRARPRRT